MFLKFIFTGAALLGGMLPASADTGMNFFFSSKGFSTISGSKGNEVSHSTGFTITNNDGVELYSSDAPGGGSPCAAYEGTTRKLYMTLSMPQSWCSYQWTGYKFHCLNSI